MTTDSSKPVDYLGEFQERATCLAEIIELLRQKLRSPEGNLWAHHWRSMLDKLDFFRGLLQDEIDYWGEWRYHGFQPDEVLDMIDEDLERLGAWLSRMIT